MYSMPGTTFTLRIQGVCHDGGRLIPLNDTWTWTVVANPQTFRLLIDWLHTSEIDMLEERRAHGLIHAAQIDRHAGHRIRGAFHRDLDVVVVAVRSRAGPVELDVVRGTQARVLQPVPGAGVQRMALRSSRASWAFQVAVVIRWSGCRDGRGASAGGDAS